MSFSCISQPSSSFENTSAPRIKSTKHKIIWSEEGITEYQELLANTLPALQDDFSGELQNKAHNALLATTRDINSTTFERTEAGEKFRLAKSINQNLVRKHNVESECKRNEDFDSILDKNPNHAFKIIKSIKS